MSIDWSGPLEAVHEDGRVVPLVYDKPSKTCPREYQWTKDVEGVPGSWRTDGQDRSLSGWRIRNVQPTSSAAKVDDALVERMVALMRCLVDVKRNTYHEYDEVRAFAALLPNPVDPDLVEARELIADAVAYGYGKTMDPERPAAYQFRSGDCDDGELVKRALAVIKRKP